MSIGTVTAFETSRNGKPKVKIDNQWMFAGRCDISGLKVGARVEYVANEFGDPGPNGRRPQGLEKWRPVLNAAGEPTSASTLTEADILRSVSNVVGNACAAGTVKTPEELEKWFVAAFKGFQRLAQDKVPEQDPDDSAQLSEGFYQGLPPGATQPKNGNNPPW